MARSAKNAMKRTAFSALAATILAAALIVGCSDSGNTGKTPGGDAGDEMAYMFDSALVNTYWVRADAQATWSFEFAGEARPWPVPDPGLLKLAKATFVNGEDVKVYQWGSSRDIQMKDPDDHYYLSDGSYLGRGWFYINTGRLFLTEINPDGSLDKDSEILCFFETFDSTLIINRMVVYRFNEEIISLDLEQEDCSLCGRFSKNGL